MLLDLTGFEIEPVYAAAKPGDLARSVLDVTAAKEHLGWQPWTALEDGLAATVDYFRTHDT